MAGTLDHMVGLLDTLRRTVGGAKGASYADKRSVSAGASVNYCFCPRLAEAVLSYERFLIRSFNNGIIIVLGFTKTTKYLELTGFRRF